MDEECKANQSSSNKSKRIYGIDYLRSINILGTVIIHSCLSYSPAIQERLSSGLKAQIPLIDYTTQFSFIDVLIVIRSTYSMQLMFLMSGLFTWRSLSKKGDYAYIIERIKRLGLPFLAGILILIPLAYYPGYLVEAEHASTLLIFLKTYYLKGPYYGLHLWFLWLLFGFDLIVTASHFMLRPFQIKPLQLKIGLILIVITLLTGILINKQLAQNFGPYNWIHIYGPFDLQLDCLPLYFSYFVCGCLVGNIGLDKLIDVCAPKGITLLLGLSLFAAIDIVLNVVYLQGCLKPGASYDQTLNLVFHFTTFLTVSLLLVVFYHIFPARNTIFDNLQRNSFTIYIIHYTIAAWMQFGVIKSNIRSIDKPLLVVSIAIPMCWLAAELWRRLFNKIIYVFSTNSKGASINFE